VEPGCSGLLPPPTTRRQGDDDVAVVWPAASGRPETLVVFDERRGIYRGRVGPPHELDPHAYRRAGARFPLNGCNRSLPGTLKPQDWRRE